MKNNEFHICFDSSQGIWNGMLWGGTGSQTLLLCILILRCNWDKEVNKHQKKKKKRKLVYHIDYDNNL